MKASYLLRTVLVSALAVLFVSCGKQEKENPDNNNQQQPEQPKTETPVIKADASSSIRAAAGTYELAVTVDHPKDGASLSVKVSDEADWITEAVAGGQGVKLTVSDNLSAARQTRLTLSYPEAKDVTVELTQAQWNYSEFGIQISNIGPFGATFDITRKTGYGGGYFFEVLDMSDFVKYVEGEKNQVGDFAYGQKLYESDLAYLNRLSQAHGHPLSDLFGMLGSMYSTEPGVKMPYSTLAPDTEYMFIVYGMNNAGERKTPLCLYAFKTGFSTDSALAFSGFAEDVTETYANLVVTPSNQTEYWYLNWVSEIDLKNLSFLRRFQLRQLLREGRSALGVVLGIFVCLLLMMIGINAYTLCLHVGHDNVADTRYEYMYLYKYPEAEVPAGGSPAYAETLKKEVLGYNLDVTVLGLEADNPYFDAHPERSQSRVQISSAMAQKYRLKPGQQLVLCDAQNERSFAFTVESVVEYAPAFFVFMDLDSMRELFGMPEDYYNAVFSDHDLQIEPGRLYSTSSKADVVKAADVFVNLMYSMVYTMILVSFIIMAIVMYLMMKVMLDRSAQSIALFKVFGYRKREISRLFLDGNTILILLGTLVSIPLAKVIMDAMYPYLVSNVACAINLHLPIWVYMILFLSCLLIYALIHAVLVRRIRKIPANEILKNRE